MTKKTIQTQQRAGLGMWLLRGPLKFTATFLGLSILTSAAYGIIAGLIWQNQAPIWPISAIMLIVTVFCISKLIKRLPDDKQFDRNSFVALTGGAIATIFLLQNIHMWIAPKIMRSMMILMSNPAAKSNVAGYAFAGLFVMAILSLCVLAIVIAMVYTTYLRARAMGVSKLRAISSLPFSMLWIPGYFTPNQNTKSTPTIDVRPAWYKRLINRICENSVATWLSCMLIITLCGIIYGTAALLCMAVPFAIYAAWRIIRGAARTRDDIRGPLAIVSIIINILTIAYVVCSVIPTAHKPQPQAEVIEISDTAADTK